MSISRTTISSSLEIRKRNSTRSTGRANLPPDPTCYVAAPARTEPEVAPPRGEALYVLVHTPYLRSHHDWKQLLPAYRRTILDKLASTGGLHDLEQRIRFERWLTPQDIHDRFHVLNGAIYGLASHGKLLGAFKPSNRSPDVKGLYFAGGSAHPGPGMPMVLMSGWIAADALDRDGVVPQIDLPPHGPTRSRGGGLKLDENDGRQLHDSACPARAARLPHRSGSLYRWFSWWVSGYLEKHFHAVRLSRGTRPSVPPDLPLIIVLNHPAWWDPLIGVVLAGLIPKHTHYAPMDAHALGRYSLFNKLGFYGVEQGTPRGAAAFLRTTTAILSQPSSAVWITAQGEFTDPRVRPTLLRPGVGHIARRLDKGLILTLALEYPFWEERLPEALARFGEPMLIGRKRKLSAESGSSSLRLT